MSIRKQVLLATFVVALAGGSTSAVAQSQKPITGADLYEDCRSLNPDDPRK